MHIVYQSLSDQHDQYALTYRCVLFMRSSRKRCRLDSIILITEASWPLWWCNDYRWKIMVSIPVRDKPKNIKFVFPKQTILRIKNKNLFVWNQDNVSNGASFESLDIFLRCIKKRKTNSVDKTSIKQALSSSSHYKETRKFDHLAFDYTQSFPELGSQVLIYILVHLHIWTWGKSKPSFTKKLHKRENVFFSFHCCFKFQS